MASHLYPLGRMRCDEVGCDRAATVQLRNTYNSPLGKFCAKHGKRALEKQLVADRARSMEPPPLGKT